jgi:hypothetical protein
MTIKLSGAIDGVTCETTNYSVFTDWAGLELNAPGGESIRNDSKYIEMHHKIKGNVILFRFD